MEQSILNEFLKDRIEDLKLPGPQRAAKRYARHALYLLIPELMDCLQRSFYRGCEYGRANPMPATITYVTGKKKPKRR